MKMTPKQAVHKHEAAMHPGKPKTKLAKGGVTNEMLMQSGRNMAQPRRRWAQGEVT
jgi:hypothetical protein